MQSFSDILSRLQNGQTEQRVDTPSQPAPIASSSLKASNKPASSVTNGTRTIPTTSLKRKSDDNDSSARKAPKLEGGVAAQQPVLDANGSARFVLTKPGVKKGLSANNSPRQSPGPASIVKKTTVSKSATVPAVVSQQANAAPKAPPKKGFAGLMERAKAAQEASEKAGPNIIKHKPMEVVTKRERQRLIQEAKDQKAGRKQNGKLAAQVVPGRAGQPQVGVRKGPIPLEYQGTMGKKSAVTADDPRKKRKLVGQDKYGGYASWSDLDEAGGEENSYYDSESDMEEAGFDDMLEEEEQSARLARKEDQQALEEETRLKREKEARKQRLMALNKNAAAKKRY